MEGGQLHQHIASVRWTNPETLVSGESSREEMVVWIRNNGQAFVTDGTHSIWVGVVDATPPYIRTNADGVWTDNLLALPAF
ncbi:MAG: DUF3892 domain-containing protein [Chloroflexota bacterium]|nr:DUF3892 domain-containing protein [Chloroflexota bacterium]